MERLIEGELKEQIINFGAFGYTVKKMSYILMWDVSEVESLLNDVSSDFHKCYMKGEHTKDYIIDEKLFDMARSGDLKALSKFEHRVSQRKG